MHVTYPEHEPVTAYHIVEKKPKQYLLTINLKTLKDMWKISYKKHNLNNNLKVLVKVILDY